jgi:hypothetical protein
MEVGGEGAERPHIVALSVAAFGHGDKVPFGSDVNAATTLMLLVVALLACWVPGRCAARLNPLEALRAE